MTMEHITYVHTVKFLIHQKLRLKKSVHNNTITLPHCYSNYVVMFARSIQCVLIRKQKWSILLHHEYKNVFHTFKDYILPHDEPYTKPNR